MRFALPFAVLSLLIAGFARADTAVYQAQQLVRYQRYAGAPVDEFPMLNLWRWQVVGPEKLVAWPTVTNAYLITVDKPCIRLEWTKGLGLTQTMSMKVSNKFDFVVFGHERCKIAEIRPIDYRAMRQDDKAATPAQN